jgi:bifunctional ADP-heptose synthase (sugar kinase/adenylyltransferase)
MKKRVLIIGESCRDIFVYCNANRLCPDAPVPVLNVINQQENGGMAKNVQRNIEQYIECDIITNYNWYNITKTRYVHDKSNHVFFRVDSNDKIERIDLSKINYDYDIIVISDYNKGFLTEEDIQLISSKHDNVFIDTKKILGNWIKNCKYIKINDYEFNNSKNFITSEFSDKIIHTIGGDGCEFNGKQYKVNRVEVKDTSGAGDSFMSGLVIEFLKSGDIEKSIIFANKCASEVVKHIGVTIIQ